MTASSPALTVLMPVYNASEYLSETIESILNQTFQNFQLLIVNDGSTDNSQKIIESYASKDDRVRVLYQENAGIVKTLNRGISLSTTELIARHDADDISLPTRFEKQINFLKQNPDCALVGSAIETFGDNHPPRRIYHYEFHEQITDCFLLENSLAHGSVMFRKSAVLKQGGYTEASHAKHIEDYDLWARLARKHRVSNLGEILYRYRIHSGSISSQQATLQKHNTRALAKRIRTEKWYRDFWRISSFNARHWNHVPGTPQSKELEAQRRLIYFQGRTIAALIFLREWRAASIRLIVSMRHSPIKTPLNMIKWIARTGGPALLRKWRFIK